MESHRLRAASPHHIHLAAARRRPLTKRALRVVIVHGRPEPVQYHVEQARHALHLVHDDPVGCRPREHP
jgi:hypothetical protein